MLERLIPLRRTALLALLAAMGWAPPGLAQQTRPALQTGPVDQAAITIDGALEEAAWQQAAAATGFRQLEPSEGEPASQKTEVHVLRGPEDLYVGAILHDGNPDEIRARLGRRDELNQADWFLVSIDSYFNQSTAYTFAVNAAGVQLDAIRIGGGESEGPGPDVGDTAWDAVWSSEVRITKRGWVVEMRIPYSMLRFSEGSQRWGIHFTRRNPRLGERSEWPLVPRTQRSNLVANYGVLHGLEGIDPRRNVQVRPYTVGRLETDDAPQQPGEQVQRETEADVGGDLKVGLTSNLTLDATINPDFGQVESDPAVLNLTAFETFYEERRPFFTESMQIYQFDVGPGTLLYTRRIGGQAPIIGATKLSGRTADGLSVGVLGATTGNAFDPTRHYGTARLSQQIGSFSSAGGIVTGFAGPVAGIQKQSLAGGTDYDLRFLGNRYGVEGFAAFTHERWNGADRAPSTGFAGKVWARRRQGVWTGFLGLDVFSNRFDPNDLGQLHENNFIALLNRTNYDINAGQPFGPFQRASVGGFGIQRFSFRDGVNIGLSYNLESQWTLKSFQQVGLNVSAERPFGGYDLYETRGLGPWARPFGLEGSGEFETDERRSWQLGPEGTVSYYEDGGLGYTVGLRSTWDVGSRLSLEGNVRLETENGVTAWTSNEAFTLRDGTWFIGTRSVAPDALDPGEFEALASPGALDEILAEVSPYDREGNYFVPVFGARDTRSLDVTLRSNITFRPGLSLQFYGQIFVARGKYQEFQILQNRDTLVPFDAYPKRDAFSLSSLQFNTVLRWEYQPGSRLYLVWTQGRREDEQLNPLAPWEPSPYETPTGRQLLDTFSLFPRNMFLLKLDYTFLY